MITPSSGYRINQSALRLMGHGGQGVLITLDWSKRHELLPVLSGGMGLTITAVTWDVMLNDAPSTDITTASPAISASGLAVQTRITSVSGVYGAQYELICQVTLSDGTVLDPESIPIPIEQL